MIRSHKESHFTPQASSQRLENRASNILLNPRSHRKSYLEAPLWDLIQGELSFSLHTARLELLHASLRGCIFLRAIQNILNIHISVGHGKVWQVLDVIDSQLQATIVNLTSM